MIIKVMKKEIDPYTVAEDIAYLRYVGVKPVVVHGGGPQISRMLERLDIPSEFQGGYRVTSTEAVSVVPCCPSRISTSRPPIFN